MKNKPHVEQICDCKRKMINLGNISGIIFTSNPPQWDEVYVCRVCKKKKTVRERGSTAMAAYLSEYEEIE